MTNVPETRVDRVTVFDISHNGEAVRVETLHFADGGRLDYRLVHDDKTDQDVPVPVDGALAEALLAE